MKTALCFYGIVGGTSGKYGKGSQIDPSIAAKTIHQHIIEPNDVDVFIHTWSTDFENKLNKLYTPINAQYQKQIIFHDDLRTHCILSRWYSNGCVLNQKAQHAIDNNFVYDCVMLCRFDIAFFSTFNFNEYDMNYFWASHWNDEQGVLHFVNEGFADLWFFSNSEFMNKFGLLYNNIEQYSPSPHIMAYQHVKSFTDKIKYTKYRFVDYEIVRRHHLECKE